METQSAKSAGYQTVSNSDALSTGIVTVNNLTPDALMIYLQDRMSSIDDQANTAFEKQKKIGEIQKASGTVQNALAALDETKGGNLKLTSEVAASLETLRTLDPKFAAEIEGKLGIPTGQPATGAPLEYQLDKDNLAGLKTTFQNYSKQQESSASLEMIHLQSIMSARQTAVQLSTNLVSALGKSQESIAANIGH